LVLPLSVPSRLENVVRADTLATVCGSASVHCLGLHESSLVCSSGGAGEAVSPSNVRISLNGPCLCPLLQSRNAEEGVARPNGACKGQPGVSTSSKSCLLPTGSETVLAKVGYAWKASWLPPWKLLAKTVFCRGVGTPLVLAFLCDREFGATPTLLSMALNERHHGNGEPYGESSKVQVLCHFAELLSWHVLRTPDLPNDELPYARCTS
jgi:hypothetical protein